MFFFYRHQHTDSSQDLFKSLRQYTQGSIFKDGRTKRANFDVRIAEYLAKMNTRRCSTVACGLIDIIET